MYKLDLFNNTNNNINNNNSTGNINGNALFENEEKILNLSSLLNDRQILQETISGNELLFDL